MAIFLSCNCTSLLRPISHWRCISHSTAARKRCVKYRKTEVFLTNNNNNSVASVRERTILTEKPPFVDEVSANFCVESWSARRIPTAVISVLDRSRYFFFHVAPQLYSRGWVDPVPNPCHVWPPVTWCTAQNDVGSQLLILNVRAT
jgi:hypothetical protein